MGSHLTLNEARTMGFQVDKNELGTIVKFESSDKHVIIPSTINGKVVDTILPDAFKDKGLKSVLFPNTLKSIGARAFQDNNLEYVALPSDLSIIGESAFRDNQIAELVFNCDRSVTLNSFAFYNNFISILKIPKNVVGLGQEIFGNNLLKKVMLLESPCNTNMFVGNPNIKFYSSIKKTKAGLNNNYFVEDYIHPHTNNRDSVLVSGNNTGDIPKHVTVIGPKAFKGAKLKEINIPPNVVELGIRCLENSGLNQIYIPATVVKLYANIFGDNSENFPAVIVDKNSVAEEAAIANSWNYTLLEEKLIGVGLKRKAIKALEQDYDSNLNSPSMAEILYGSNTEKSIAENERVQGSDAASTAKVMQGNIETDRHSRLKDDETKVYTLTMSKRSKAVKEEICEEQSPVIKVPKGPEYDKGRTSGLTGSNIFGEK